MSDIEPRIAEIITAHCGSSWASYAPGLAAAIVADLGLTEDQSCSHELMGDPIRRYTTPWEEGR